MVESKAHSVRGHSGRETLPIYVSGMPCLVHFLADICVWVQHDTAHNKSPMDILTSITVMEWSHHNHGWLQNPILSLYNVKSCIPSLRSGIHRPRHRATSIGSLARTVRLDTKPGEIWGRPWSVEGQTTGNVRISSHHRSNIGELASRDFDMCRDAATC